MNGKSFLYAMEDIQDGYIVSAQECLGYLTNHKKSRPRSMKRIFTVALAAVLALVCTMAAAMAVSPKLRAAVISLFQLETEQVPGIPAGVNEVRQVTIGETVKANYVKVDGVWNWITSDGALLCQGAWNAKGSKFYELDGETLTEIGADAPAAYARTSRNGREYNVLFRWFVYDGMLYTDDITGTLPDHAVYRLTPSRIGERTDVVQLTSIATGTFIETYTWVYDLESGEVTDVLEGCGVEALGPILTVTLAEDLKHAIVQPGETSDGTPYLADLEKKTLTPLSELFGMEITGWQFMTAEDGGCCAVFCDNDTILLTTGTENRRVTGKEAWTYHIPTGALVCTVADGTGLRPIESRRLALSVDETGSVSIVDLTTGGRVKLEGINGNGEFICKANGADTKLLWAEWRNLDGPHTTSVDRLGVIDLETGVFTAFDREHQDELSDEWVYWLGDDRVMIVNDLHKQEGFSPEPTSEYYFCVYEF